MKKICFVIGTLVAGGAEKQLYCLIKYLDRKKFQPVVIALRSGSMDLWKKWYHFKVDKILGNFTKKIICVSEDKKKSIDVLLSVVPELRKEIKNLRILIVGEREEKRNLMEIVKKLKTENPVVFTGFRKDILSIIKISDIVVLTSKWEGMPNLILDRIALGKSVISTDIGGGKEIIEDGVNGFLLKYGDKKALINKIFYLYKNPEVRKKWGKKDTK